MSRRSRRSIGVCVVVALCVAAVAVSGGAVLGQDFPPPTPVPPNGSPSPYPTALSTPQPSEDPPRLRVRAAALVDTDGGQMLFERRGDERRPIASLTKLMTALLVVERVPRGELVTASATAAAQTGAELGLQPGEVLPVEDLLYALLLQSANDAAVALAEHVSGSVDAFVAEMNERARDLGLGETEFFSPNGLDDRGRSTAHDVARLTRVALDTPGLAGILATRFHDVPSPGGEPRHIQNRNALLWLYEGTTGGKTGFTTAAGYCLVATAERGGERLVAVVLGGPAQAWDDAAALLDHGFHAFDRETVLEAGEEVEEVDVQGTPIPAVVSRSVFAYVREASPEPDVTIRLRGGLRPPLREGQPLGLAVVALEGVPIDRVPVEVGDLPDPPGTGRPYWVRVAAVLGAYVGALLLRS